MIDITELLENVKIGKTFYSPLFGEVKLKFVVPHDHITVETETGETKMFNQYGVYFVGYSNSECLLFPSKDRRTWEGWEAPVEHNFEAGDWIVYKDGGTFSCGSKKVQVQSIEKDRYIFIPTTNGGCNFIDSECRLWNIKDAEDGDVLVSGVGNPFIYNGNVEFSSAGAYVGVSRDGKIRFDMFPSKGWASVKDVKPATQEQRTLLFKKMQEAGYQWYAGEKELRKIKPHYDITNFHAGMPVLVRDKDNRKWCYLLYSHYDNTYEDGLCFNAGSVDWRQCIPFNDKTKHLLGTTDPCPEELINW